MKLLIKKLDERAVIPARQTQFSAGYDLSACCGEPITVKAGQTVKVHTGVAMEIDGDKSTVGLIYARSGLATKFGLAPANCVGVIDWDYRGEVIVALHNSSENDFVINHGDRIAQLVLAPVFTPEVEVADELSGTVRGEGGFGSTNK
ncbi:dUTP diphosphatase [Ruminococcus sp. FC2018]|uniref:dUTP diphosphatase n=1 Tax=Ruminococcus sp. FC2018 TaxID=1410617 RepID=UPI00048E9298|nr:dUTP diphosphatase [Ruminococcus sp. FC2018]